MIVNIPARLLTPLLPALLRAESEASRRGDNLHLTPKARGVAQQDQRALTDLRRVLLSALDTQPYSVAALAVLESESLSPADCCPVTGQEYGTGA